MNWRRHRDGCRRDDCADSQGAARGILADLPEAGEAEEPIKLVAINLWEVFQQTEEHSALSIEILYKSPRRDCMQGLHEAIPFVETC